MSSEKKYLKYKNKYLKLKKLIGGTTQDEINDIINHTYLVSAVNVVSIMKPSEDLSDLHLYYNRKREDEISSPLEHSYPTIHSAFGTLVYSHGSNIWDFNELAIINKMSTQTYRGKIYKMNPFDTMIISNRINVDNDTIVIISSRFMNSEYYNNFWKKWLDKINPNNLVYFDDKFKDEIKKDDSFDVQEILLRYNIEAIRNKLPTTTIEIMQTYINSITNTVSTSDGRSMTMMSPFIMKRELNILYPTILSRVLFKECLRDTINKIIKQKTPEGTYTYKNIYCDNNEQQTRFSDPMCLRKIFNGLVETSDVRDVRNPLDSVLENDNDHKGEDSIYGKHNGSLLDTPQGKVYKLDDSNTGKNVLILIDQYLALLKREFLKIGLQNQPIIIATQIVGLIFKKKREDIKSKITDENRKITNENKKIKEENKKIIEDNKKIIEDNKKIKDEIPLRKILSVNDSILDKFVPNDQIKSTLISLIEKYINYKNEDNKEQITEYEEALTKSITSIFNDINTQLYDSIKKGTL